MLLKDLIVGDWWLNSEGNPIQITEDFIKTEDLQNLNMRPIRLTDEIMEKNFDRIQKEDKITYCLPNGLFFHENRGGGYLLVHMGGVKNKVEYVICYVHQLQHWLNILEYDKKIYLC